jgi:hypothetical protein
MKARKLEARKNRLNRANDQIETHKKYLKEKGKDEKAIMKDSKMRNLLAEARKIQRSIDSLLWEPPKVEQIEKPEKSEKPEKGEKREKREKPEKAAKEAAQPKAPKPPKEKKPKKEEEAPPA